MFLLFARCRPRRLCAPELTRRRPERRSEQSGSRPVEARPNGLIGVLLVDHHGLPAAAPDPTDLAPIHTGVLPWYTVDMAVKSSGTASRNLYCLHQHRSRNEQRFAGIERCTLVEATKLSLRGFDKNAPIYACGASSIAGCGVRGHLDRLSGGAARLVVSIGRSLVAAAQTRRR